ncbi:MAG: accessory gene regulator B family protein [Lachnospiraceae bacterium]|nr:accessory gene regulator B family protein [Lachnospiraceae bacterium]
MSALKTVSKSITEMMIENHIVDESSRSLYVYSYEKLLEKICFIVYIFGIGTLMDCISYSIVFSLVFIPVRSFCGGIHAGTKRKCTVLSALIPPLVFLASPYLELLPVELLFSIYILSIVLLILFPCIDHANKFFSDTRKAQLRSIALKYFFILTIAYLILLFFRNRDLINCLSSCIIMNVVFSMWGRLTLTAPPPKTA